MVSDASGTRHAYLFLLQLDDTEAFMGCTPEKLFKLEGGQLTTEALAGTRSRGDTVESDQQLAHAVMLPIRLERANANASPPSHCYCAHTPISMLVLVVVALRERPTRGDGSA